MTSRRPAIRKGRTTLRAAAISGCCGLRPMTASRGTPSSAPPSIRRRPMRARWRHLGLRAIGACDAALWDIAGKAAGMPLYRLLGGGRSEIGAYASSQMLESRDAYAAEAARFKAEGWKAYKIHPPHGPDEDIKVCEAVRTAVGEDFTLMLDSTWSYRYPDALRVGRAIERLGFLWYEDPLNEEDIYSYV